MKREVITEEILLEEDHPKKGINNSFLDIVSPIITLGIKH